MPPDPQMSETARTPNHKIKDNFFEPAKEHMGDVQGEQIQKMEQRIHYHALGWTMECKENYNQHVLIRRYTKLRNLEPETTCKTTRTEKRFK